MADDDLGRRLLAIARHAIARELSLETIEPDPCGALSRPGATFVTLMRAGELRGCIGSLRAARPLAVDVRENAIAAAFRDPRFPPLTKAEFASTSIELSLLSAPQDACCDTEGELCARLVPFVDGVAIELGECRATFLPQVWDTIPDPHAFLAALKAKADLPANFWSPRLNVSLYQVTKWKESELLQAGIVS